MTTIKLPNAFSLSAHDFEMDVKELPITTIVYLLANGYSQSLTDAGTTAAAKAAIDEVKAENARRAARGWPILTKVEQNAFIASDAVTELKAEASKAKRAERVDALLAGTMIYGARGPNGPRRTPMEQWIYDAAESTIRAFARTAGLKVPSDKDELAAMIDGYIEANRPEFEARYATQPKGDLAALFAKG